jgi:hypothetical protein
MYTLKVQFRICQQKILFKNLKDDYQNDQVQKSWNVETIKYIAATSNLF